VTQPIITSRADGRPFTAAGNSFEIHEWSGSGPDYLHVHHADDEAWHVLEGRLTFRFADSEVVVAAGDTVFVPAGVPHTYRETDGRARYLMILTPRLHRLITELHSTPYPEHGDVLRRYNSEIVR
jgi:mannose-6-phosphate isomerase-like protein (cupin superfamily)